MLLDHNSSYKKVIIPWYDSEPACLLLMAFMLLIFLFGLAGISVALDNPPYRDFAWVPILLVILSGGVGAAAGVRWFSRFS